MKVVIDLDSHQAIQDFGNKSPVGAYQFKSQDTVEWELYFVQGGIVQDLGAGFALKFGMVRTGDTTNTLLAYQTGFTHLTDASGNVYYSGLVNFNTSQMASAIGSLPQIAGTVEIRYQDSLSEIIHTINIATEVYATILVETGVTPPSVASGYPDASTIELLVHKNAVNGYAGLDAGGDLAGSVIPVDTQTIVINTNGDIASAAILASATANWTTPASGGNVTVTVDSTSNLKALAYVRIPIAGYYIVESITDATHVVLQNNGDPFNAISGVTITAGSVLLPAQAAAGGGSTPGANAFTTTSASFTVPAVGATVTVNMGSTAWLGGSGYVVFIQSAGYYAVSSVTDSTHAVLTNLGYAATNAAAGTTITSGSAVTPGGVQGATGTSAIGANAYDTTQASFLMPAAGSGINITITNTSWLGVGQEVYVAGAGYFSVSSITSPTIFAAVNSNYPGAATPGATIASGAKVSPAGVIGPQGAGGPGLNAFTTLTSNFTQPAIGANVTAIVGTTAWMVATEVIYIAGGGYYQISTIADLTHVTVTNLGYSGNAAPATTVAGSGTQGVSPGGLLGPAGANPYTTTIASFTMPASGSSVTVNVSNTAFMAAGQNIFVSGAGYFTVASVTDSTHVVLTNNGAAGNASSGAVIPVGSSVAPAGANGQTGAQGAQGPAGRDGAYATVYTGNSVAGTGGSSTPVVLVNDAAQGTNAYAHYQRDASGNNLWAPIPTDGTTITVSAGKLTVLSAPGGGAFDPANGLWAYDDFCTPTLVNDPRYTRETNNGTVNAGATYGQANATLKILGCVELTTGTTSAANSGADFYWGAVTSPAAYPILYGLGAFTWKTRIFLEGTLPTTGISYVFRAGIGQELGTFYGYTNNPIQGFFFEYDPGQNSGLWRVAYATTGTPTYTNTSATVAGDTAYDLEIDANAAWTTLTFKINGATAATLSSGFPTAVNGCPVWMLSRGTGSTINYKAAIDSWMINYAFTR